MRRPISRLIAKNVFSGLVTAWRFAAWPTRRSPDSVNATIEGVVRPPSVFSMTLAFLPSITATQEFVVPRSMPITLLMGTSCPKQDRSARESTVPIPRECSCRDFASAEPRQPRGLYMWRGWRPATGTALLVVHHRGAARVIVSASYRTDIPAFYAEWLMRRLSAGWCRVANPYGGAAYEVSLRPGVVDGFVLWTRNLRPLLPHLDAIRAVAPLVVQFTVTGYPRPLESSVIAAAEAVAQLHEIRRRFGSRAAVWRYDPIVFTDALDAAAHRAGFAALARALRGTVDEVVLSVMQPYRKTRRNLDHAARHHGFAWRDPPAEEKRALLAGLA